MNLQVRIWKRLGGFLLDVDFQAPLGVTALFGPSGSGKTQTLRCIAGLTRPDEGRIVAKSRVLLDTSTRVNLPARERRVGYVLQQYALFPHLNVAGNVAYGLARWPHSRRDERVVELLALVGLDGYEHRYPRELSGGQQQRVALARALAPMPDLLLLDEPFAAVDALTRVQLRRELRELHELTGVPMVLVTHDLIEVRQLAGFVVLYEEGRVLQSGEPDAVLASPENDRVAALLRAATAI